MNLRSPFADYKVRPNVRLVDVYFEENRRAEQRRQNRIAVLIGLILGVAFGGGYLVGLVSR
jgi:hypothetical protein